MAVRADVFFRALRFAPSAACRAFVAPFATFGLVGVFCGVVLAGPFVGVGRNLFRFLRLLRGFERLSLCCGEGRFKEHPHRLQVVGRYGVFNLRRVQVGDDAGNDKGLLEVFVGIRPGEAKGGSDRSHEGFTLCHRCAVREEAPVLLAVGSVFHTGGLQGAVDFLRGLEEPEAAGRLRHSDRDRHGHVMHMGAIPARASLAGGSRHFDATVASLGSPGGRGNDADVCCGGQLHAADLRDRVGAAGFLIVDVLARAVVGTVLPDVELHFRNGDTLEVAGDLHGRDRHEDVILFAVVLVELHDSVGGVHRLSSFKKVLTRAAARAIL